MNIYQTKFLILYIIFFSHCKNKDIINICPEYKFRDSIYFSKSSKYLYFSTIYNYDTSYYFATEIDDGYIYFLKNRIKNEHKLYIGPIFNKIIIDPESHFDKLFKQSEIFNSSYRKSERKSIFKSNYFYTYYSYEITFEFPIVVISGIYYNSKEQFIVGIELSSSEFVAETEMECFMETLCSSFHLEKCNWIIFVNHFLGKIFNITTDKNENIQIFDTEQEKYTIH